VAKARPIDFTKDLPYGEAAARAITVRAEELAQHAHGVLDTDDIERVHDLRVTTRRLRAALEIFEPCFPAKRYKRALGEVKRLADGLGERRDRDVAIGSLEGFGAKLAAPDRPGIASLVDRLREEQEEANRALAELVEPGEIEALIDRLRGLAESSRQRVGERAG
jgi:CHAD domain-containing protein